MKIVEKIRRNKEDVADILTGVLTCLSILRSVDLAQPILHRLAPAGRDYSSAAALENNICAILTDPDHYSFRKIVRMLMPASDNSLFLTRLFFAQYKLTNHDCRRLTIDLIKGIQDCDIELIRELHAILAEQDTWTQEKCGVLIQDLSNNTLLQPAATNAQQNLTYYTCEEEWTSSSSSSDCEDRLEDCTTSESDLCTEFEDSDNNSGCDPVDQGCCLPITHLFSSQNMRDGVRSMYRGVRSFARYNFG